MLLTVFGATGTVGRHLVQQALNEGYRVRAFARRPETLGIDHPELTMIRGDVLDAAAVSEAVDGADSVLITLGSKGLTGNIRSEGTRRIVDAMQRRGVRRLICQTTLGVGDSRSNLDFYWKVLMFGIVLRAVFKDHVIQEQIVRDSGLDWTIVRPSAFIDGPLSEKVKHGFAPTERNLTLKISRADVARFMLRQTTDNTYLHRAPGLSC